MHLLYRSNNFQKLLERYNKCIAAGGLVEVLLCERVNDLRHSLFHLNCFITTASELRE